MSRIEPLARLRVGVVVERRKAKSPWVEFVWRPVAVLPGVPEAERWTAFEGDADCAMLYAGVGDVELYRSDCANYRANLDTGAARLWIVLRPTGSVPPFDIIAVTADPSEAEAFTESGTDVVDSAPMPEAIREAVAAFVAAHHVEDQPFVKRQRDHADPEALARRKPGEDRQ